MPLSWVYKTSGRLVIEENSDGLGDSGRYVEFYRSWSRIFFTARKNKLKLQTASSFFSQHIKLLGLDIFNRNNFFLLCSQVEDDIEKVKNVSSIYKYRQSPCYWVEFFHFAKAFYLGLTLLFVLLSTGRGRHREGEERVQYL